jgi:hypothetical protein
MSGRLAVAPLSDGRLQLWAINPATQSVFSEGVVGSNRKLEPQLVRPEFLLEVEVIAARA